MPLTEPDLWISHIRLFGLSPETRKTSIEVVMNFGSRERVMLEVLVESSPIHRTLLTPAIQPFTHGVQHSSIECDSASVVAAHPIILEVASELGAQRLPPVFDLDFVANAFKP